MVELEIEPRSSVSSKSHTLSRICLWAGLEEISMAAEKPERLMQNSKHRTVEVAVG